MYQVDEIRDTHLRFMLDHDVVVPADNKKLPGFYWLTKLHKIYSSFISMYN